VYYFGVFWTGARFDDGAGGDNEVQRTMLELINQLDGFDPRGNIKVLMATNRPDTLDPALMRPGRLDRKIEFGLPDLEVSNDLEVVCDHDSFISKTTGEKIEILGERKREGIA
jgi:ATP-dependent 26S proteasome regulatory subunit